MKIAKADKSNPAAVALGRLGGKAGTGKAKARKVTSEQVRAGAKAKWDKYYKEHPEKARKRTGR